MIHVWDWKTGNMLKKLNQKFQSFCILMHPIHEDLLFTAGEDGRLFVSFISLYRYV